MRIATIILCILDAVGWAVVARNTFFSESDPTFMGWDVTAGWIVTILFLITAVPGFALALSGRRAKTSLALALAFPAGFAALFVAVLIYFDFM